MTSSLRFPSGEREGESLSKLKRGVSRPASAARLLPTMSSPSLEDEGRIVFEGSGDAVWAARFILVSSAVRRPAPLNSNRVTGIWRDALRAAFAAAAVRRAFLGRGRCRLLIHKTKLLR